MQIHGGHILCGDPHGRRLETTVKPGQNSFYAPGQLCVHRKRWMGRGATEAQIATGGIDHRLVVHRRMDGGNIAANNAKGLVQGDDNGIIQLEVQDALDRIFSFRSVHDGLHRKRPSHRPGHRPDLKSALFRHRHPGAPEHRPGSSPARAFKYEINRQFSPEQSRRGFPLQELESVSPNTQAGVFQFHRDPEATMRGIETSQWASVSGSARSLMATISMGQRQYSYKARRILRPMRP
jgi:hypothetical protein